MPLIYRLTSIWGNHEGSMMLWVFILTLFGVLVAAFGGNLPVRLKANALAVQAWIAAAFQLVILMTSNLTEPHLTRTVAWTGGVGLARQATYASGAVTA
jgi:cytochrome c biogenesis factor